MDYEKITEGIRVSVRPSFSFPYSEPEDGRIELKSGRHECLVWTDEVATKRWKNH